MANLDNVMTLAAERALPRLLRDFGELEQLQTEKKQTLFIDKALEACAATVYEYLSHARSGFSCNNQPRQSPDIPCWCVWPITGLINFSHGIPHFAIIIALKEGKKVTTALLYDPIRNEVFRAQKREGARMNRRRINASSRSSLERSLVVLASGSEKDSPADLVPLHQILADNNITSHITGASLLDVAWLSCGRIDGFLWQNPSPLEQALANLFFGEVGAEQLTALGDGFFYGGNPNLGPHMRALLKKRKAD